jgi:hypothetical protein
VTDWRQSLPQIIAAIIGSGLIVTAFSTINSFIFKPAIDISVSHSGILTNTVFLKNIGYAPATHLRLTMHYPRTMTLHYTTEYENENMTVNNDRQTSSLVAFLPRLTPGGNVSIGISDFDSVVATYDQGSSEYRPHLLESLFGTPLSIMNTILQPMILIVLGFLSFAIALRHKRRSKSKLASDILIDIMNVRKELNNNDKGDPSGIILRLHAWQSNIDNERQIVSNYRDYQKIDDFYSTVKSRNRYLLQNQVSSDVLSILNKDCLNKATIVYTEIDWRKFQKLDLILLIPAIILGSLFITLVPLWTVQQLFFTVSTIVFVCLLITLRGISAFFIIRLALKAAQGVIVNYYDLPTIFRSYAFLLCHSRNNTRILISIPFPSFFDFCLVWLRSICHRGYWRYVLVDMGYLDLVYEAQS